MYANSFQTAMVPSYRKHLAVKSLFRETGTYNDVFRRSYSSANVDGNLAMDFRQLVAGANEHTLGYTADMMASVSNRLLRPSAQLFNPGLDVGKIANGWGNRRFLFTMEIATDVSGNANIQPERIVLNGYTDYTGATHTGTMDPNMRIYFNSITQLRNVSRGGFAGNGNVIVPTEISHVIGMMDDSQFNPYVLLRPQDVVNDIENAQLYSTETYDVTDTRSSPVSAPLMSSRNNAIATKYLEKTFQSLLKGYRDPSVGEDQRTIYSSAVEHLKENYTTKLAFFSDLAASTSYTQLGFVTYGEMCKLIPNLDQVSGISFAGTPSVTGSAGSGYFGIPERGSMNSWSGSEQETIIASVLASSVPALMMECLISTITMSFTNRTIDRGFSVVIQNATMFSENVDASVYVSHFIDRLKREVLVDITYGNTLDLSVNVAASTIEDTWLQISFMGGPQVDYVVPSFSDALISPIIGNNPRSLHDLSFSIGGLFNASVSSLDPSMGHMPTAPAGMTF